MSQTGLTKEQADARLMQIAFEFQEILLAYVHGTEEAGQVLAFYDRKKAEPLADEIQALHHYFEAP
jgi:hypothetical protein